MIERSIGLIRANRTNSKKKSREIWLLMYVHDWQAGRIPFVDEICQATDNSRSHVGGHSLHGGASDVDYISARAGARPTKNPYVGTSKQAGITNQPV